MLATCEMRSMKALVFLLMICAVVMVTAEDYDDDDGTETILKGEHTESRTYDTSSDGNEQEFQVASLSKEEQLMAYEDEAARIRREEVDPAIQRVARLSAMYNEVKKSAGWFPNAEQKRRIYSLESELNGASQALARAQSREVAMHDRMKPLWGIVSYEFMQEQQQTIKGCLKKVNQMAYDQAWWSSVFNSGRAESLTDLIMQFFIQWFMSYIIMYPFATAYYALWAAPWSIYSFSSGPTDVVVGVVAWVVSTVVMLLPLVLLAASAYWIILKYGPELQKAAEERRNRARQEQAQRQEQFRRLQEQGYYQARY